MSLQHTPLYDAHRRLGARFTDFAGWEMPLSHAGTAAEHRAVREGAGIFDLCHMGRLTVSGPGAVTALHRLVPADLNPLAEHRCRYTVVLNGLGGIVDDVIVTRAGPDGFHLCVNAVNRIRVHAALVGAAEGLDARVADESAAVAQVALQGPAIGPLVAPLLEGPFPDFMAVAPGRFRGHEVRVSRTGYTGELGVELFLPVAAAAALWDHLCEGAAPCGLGARDTLRLEMGYPLYGHELSEEVTPVEAGLGWTVDWDRADLPGGDVLHARRAHADTRLCGFELTAPGLPRDGCGVFAEGERVGTVTSGNMGLSVGHGVGLAYLPGGLASPGTGLEIEVRGRRLAAAVSRPPFWKNGSLKAAV